MFFVILSHNKARVYRQNSFFSSNPNSMDDNNSSLGLNFTVLTNDGMNKRISSPMSNGGSNRTQSKSNNSSNSNNSSMERLQQRNGSDRTIGTMKTSSSSYDNMRSMTVDNANSAFDKSDIDGLRINSSENGSSKVNFR